MLFVNGLTPKGRSPFFWTNIASTMAGPNSKNGPKNGLRPLGVNP
jgi:hypothetical protein